MGVYIPVIEMPKDGNETIIRIQSDGTVLDQYGHHLGLKAIFVPDHGRLGDLDELFKRMFVGPDGQCYPDKDVDGWDHAYTFRGIKHEILSAPTIIPADTVKEEE